MSYKRNKQEQKRELILEEATQLFIKEGFENMKISDLAKNAGVSIGAIYTLFGSKETLYNHYVMGQIDYYIDIIHEELKNHTHPIDKLKAITTIKFSAFIKNRNALKESIISDPTFFLNVSADEDDPMMYMARFIAQEVMEPLLPVSGDNKNPLELFFLYDGITFGMVKYWIVAGGDLMSRADEAVEHFLKLILPPDNQGRGSC